MTSPETSVSEPTANLLGRNPNFPNIEPCAHCGAMPCPPGTFMDEQWGIRCSWCDMQSRAKTAEQAIASWNRRAALTAAAEVRAQAAANLCEQEAAACIGDIVPGDEPGAKLAHARAGALLTAAEDIRRLEGREPFAGLPEKYHPTSDSGPAAPGIRKGE